MRQKQDFGLRRGTQAQTRTHACNSRTSERTYAQTHARTHTSTQEACHDGDSDESNDNSEDDVDSGGDGGGDDDDDASEDAKCIRCGESFLDGRHAGLSKMYLEKLSKVYPEICYQCIWWDIKQDLANSSYAYAARAGQPVYTVLSGQVQALLNHLEL